MSELIRPDLSSSEDSAVGALIGTFVGDALGMPVEGWSHRRIRESFGEMDTMVDARKGAGTYTDDTQMMVATAKSLIEKEGVDPDHLSKCFLKHFDSSRGYGRGTTRVFEKWKNGVSVDSAAGQIFDGGSFGNGGAMRIAPVGISFAGRPEELIDALEVATGITHAHPLGLGSAYLQAFLVGEAYCRDSIVGNEAVELVDEAIDHLPDRWNEGDLLSRKIASVKELLTRTGEPVEAQKVTETLGCTSKAFESVPSSIYAAVANGDSFEEALVYSVGLGGDTDTIGAMTGAISGALHGVGAVPDRWWETLENGPDGRDDVVELGRKLDQLRS